jgi:hypothetical protein
MEPPIPFAPAHAVRQELTDISRHVVILNATRGDSMASLLIVDDDANRQLLKIVLRSAGYTPAAALAKTPVRKTMFRLPAARASRDGA